MKRSKFQSRVFLILVTGVLLVTTIVDVAVAYVSSKPLVRTPVPYEIDGWKGTDVFDLVPAKDQAEITKIYRPLDSQLTWRRFEKDGHPWIEAVVQQATNYENLHDVYDCLVLAGFSPRRLAVVNLGAQPAIPAVIVEYRQAGQSYCALFCYQSHALSAVYPAQNPVEQALLAVVGRVPCRLIELTTLANANKQQAMARLTELGIALSSQPL